jgi:hypothetical protein
MKPDVTYKNVFTTPSLVGEGPGERGILQTDINSITPTTQRRMIDYYPPVLRPNNPIITATNPIA